MKQYKGKNVKVIRTGGKNSRIVYRGKQIVVPNKELKKAKTKPKTAKKVKAVLKKTKKKVLAKKIKKKTASKPKKQVTVQQIPERTLGVVAPESAPPQEEEIPADLSPEEEVEPHQEDPDPDQHPDGDPKDLTEVFD